MTQLEEIRCREVENFIREKHREHINVISYCAEYKQFLIEGVCMCVRMCVHVSESPEALEKFRKGLGS